MKQSSKKSVGRPRSFDKEAVLDAAVLVFWEKGYEGASLDDLTTAMGINRPSLYATFGNKHGLFLASIDRYVAVQGARQAAPLREEPNLKSAISGYYREIIRTVASDETPCGCLVASVATEVAERDETVRAKIAGNLKKGEAFVDQLLADAGLADEASSLSGSVIVSAGMSLAARARLGATSEELTRLADGYIESFFNTSKTNT